MIDKYQILKRLPVKHEGAHTYEDMTQGLGHTDLIYREIELCVLDLLRDGLIDRYGDEACELVEDYSYVITPKGHSVLVQHEKELIEKKNEKHNDWVRFWVTTSISAAAIIISIIALVKVNG